MPISRRFGQHIGPQMQISLTNPRQEENVINFGFHKDRKFDIGRIVKLFGGREFRYHVGDNQWMLRDRESVMKRKCGWDLKYCREIVSYQRPKIYVR